MNAISENLKFKLGGLWRQLFQKPAPVVTVTPSAPTPIEAAPQTALPPTPGSSPGDGGVSLPLQAVLAAFPLELRSKIRGGDTGELTLMVPFEKVFSELPTGEVKMTFGDIRRTAPQVFVSGSECDGVQVVLPLNEILARLDTALFRRRATQKKSLALPVDISSPFAECGAGLTLGLLNSRPAPIESAPPRETLFARKPVLPAAPAAPISFKLPEAGDGPQFERKPAALAPKPALTPKAALTPPPSPNPSFSRPPRPKDHLTAPPVARAVQPTQPPIVAPPSKAVLMAPLTTLAAVWPDALRQEILQLGLVEARFALPVELIESSLKRGRVTFPWKTLRSWISPAVPAGPSAHDATELELALSVIAPLFLAHQKGAGSSPRVTVDETIPDLFFGLPKPETAQTARPAEPNAYNSSENSETPCMEETDYKRPKPSGTNGVAKHATPNEIVSRAAALDGVAGALIALPEGLLVAGRVPPEFNADTLAAFLPQIFSKVGQSTKELRLGELNNLSFTVGNVPWKIFRVSALYFAAFGSLSGPMPTSELARLAGELDRHH